VITKETRQKLRDIVGKENVLESNLDCFSCSYDSSFIPLLPANQPEIVVRPSKADEVSAIMKIAYACAIPVTARGAGSGRTGGSIPMHGGITLSMECMNKILELDEINMMITVEPGVQTGDIYNLCAKKGLFYPPDPASYKFSTIGGNVAENAGGMRAVKYGVTHNYVMGLEVVLASGAIIRTGGKSIKNVTGYNLTQLFTGSEGTLGIITKIILRLIPMPKVRNTLQLMFPTLDDACATIHGMIQAGVIPAAAEVMDRMSMDAVARHRKIEFQPDIQACVITEIDGDDPATLDKQARKIDEIAQSFNAIAVRIAQTPEEAEELWAMRRAMGPAVGALAPNRIGEDISVPRNEFPEIVRRIKNIAKKYALKIAVYGHAGDGNLHPSILCDLSNPDEAKRVHQAVAEIFAATLDVGGTLSGEHGIGVTKREHIADALGEDGVNALKAIKFALDPTGILNPGKIW